MSCTFSVPFNSNPADLVSQVRQAVKGMGGNMEGDETSGRIAMNSPVGHVEGEYTIGEQQITINITKKPILATCSMIKSAVTKTIARL